MATGWRRAFCTSIRRDPETTSSSTTTSSLSSKILEKQQHSPSSSSRSCVKLGIGGIFSGGSSSNPSTPRLHSASTTPRGHHSSTTSSSPLDSPKLQCKTTAAAVLTSSTTPPSSSTSSKLPNSKESPRLFHSSSPRSPSRFALFKTALRLSRNRCGICGESVSQRTAVFTAECSHAFHFPCISSHVRTRGSLVCPVCSATWQEVPLLSSSLHLHSPAAAAAAAEPPQQQILSGRGNRREKSNSNSSSSRGRREGKRAAPAGITKIYDDDESLELSPTSGGLLQFNPIPEELEEEEEEDEDEDEGDDGNGEDDNDEGQGKDEYCGQREQGDDRTETISVIPDSMALVSTGRNHLSFVVSIKVKAPPFPPRPHNVINKHDVAAAPVAMPPCLLDHPSCRAPIDLVTVLDVSGSMTVVKLQMLKRAMRLVISSLGPGDRLSIVAFSMAAAKRLLPLRRMSRAGQRSSRQIVDRLVICGSSQAQAQALGPSPHCSSTSFVGDALRKATKVLEDRRERNPVATIMLLSDGHRHGHAQQQEEQNVYSTTTCSMRDSHQTSSATRFTHIEIPIHSSGGIGGVLTQQKQRTTSHKNNANNMLVMEEGENAFAKCVNGLVSVVLQDVNLQFTFPSATAATCGEISSVYSYSYPYGDGGIGQAMSHGEGGKSIFLGDLYAAEERQLLVELKVPKATLVGGHVMPISVMCTYRDPLTRDMIHCGEQPLVMPMPMSLHPQNHNHAMQLLRSSSASSSTMTPLSTQQQLRNLFVTTRAMVESRRLVELRDLDTALHLLSSARSLLLQQSTAVSNTHKKLVLSLEAQLEDLQRQQQQQQRRRQQQRLQSLSPSQRSDQPLLGEARGAAGGGEPLTPTSAWRAAEQLANVAIMRKSLNRVSDLHGLENARF